VGGLRWRYHPAFFVGRYCAKARYFCGRMGRSYPSAKVGCFYFMEKVEYIKRIKELYRRKSGGELSDEESLEILTKLVQLVRSIYAPIKTNNKTK
jgi:hypothetical protein